ncbi:MAG: MATE family efflux transporter [Thermoprotei archaeon]|nr:MAG: MATE family efflux transporter [Thermoprotei archaeon]
MDSRASVDIIRSKIVNGPIVGTMVWLAWPVIVANLVNMSYNLIDAFWLGKLGKIAFGAPTVCWPLIMLFYSIGMGYAMAGIALISQYVGAGDREMAERSGGQLVSFLFLGALVLSGIGYAFIPQALSMIGVPQDIYPLAVSYARIIFLGIPIVFFGFAFNTIANAIGDTRTPTVLNVSSAIMNIVLDPIMIFGLLGFPAMGVAGAAIATVISRSVVSIVGGYLLFKGFKGIKIGLSDLRIEKWWLRKVFSIGTPLSIQQSFNALGFTVMMSIVSRFGSTVIAAYGVVVRILNIMQAVTWGLNRATSIMVGQNIGAEKYGRAMSIAKTSVTFTSGFLVLGALLLFVFSGQAVSFFVNEHDVIVEGSKLIHVVSSSIPFFGVFFVAGAVAAGSGHTRFFAALSTVRLWVLRIGLSILLAYTMKIGSLGVWLAMAISNIGAGTIALAWLIKGTWLRRVIEPSSGLTFKTVRPSSK